MSKLVLGLANLNAKYGKLKNTLTTKEFRKILSKKKNTLIDTAILYKKNTDILKKEKNKITIISKLPGLNLKKNIRDQIQILIFNYFKKLDVKKIDTLLLHRPEQLLDKNGAEIYIVLKDLKKRKIIKNFGYSLYNDHSLHKFINKFKPDTLQFPLNLLNNEFTKKKNINLIKKKKIKIQVRSIFLQGLLITENKIDKSLYWLKKYLNIIKVFSTKHKMSPLDCSINFIKNQKYINEIVIGCNSLENFNQIEKSFQNKKSVYPKIIISKKEKKLIDPRNWK